MNHDVLPTSPVCLPPAQTSNEIVDTKSHCKLQRQHSNGKICRPCNQGRQAHRWPWLICGLGNPGLPHCRQILYKLSHQGSPRKLEWVAYPFSRGSSQLRDWTQVSHIAGRFFTSWATREALSLIYFHCTHTPTVSPSGLQNERFVSFPKRFNFFGLYSQSISP